MNTALGSKLSTAQASFFARGLERRRVKRVKGVGHDANDICTCAKYPADMCIATADSCGCYRSPMQPEQKVVARWLKRVAQAKGWNWSEWARAAGGMMKPSTLSRAVKEEYDSVTKIETLHALARAANVPSVLDFLDGDAVSVTAMRAVLLDLLPLMPKRSWTQEDVDHFVEALVYGLGLSSSDPASAVSPDAYEVAANAAINRFRDLSA